MSFAVRQTIPAAKASKESNLFKGLSTLRGDEKKKIEAPKDSAMQAYLAKAYGGGDGDGGDGEPKKKKKKKKQDAGGGAIRILDQDATGFKELESKNRKAALKRGPPGAGGDSEDEEEEEAPTIANPEEAAALLRLEEKIKSGSGWVAADEPKPRGGRAGPSGRHDSPPDASPPRRGRRHDSPPDASPPRRGQRHDSPPDASPPRRGKRHDSPPDASPPRRRLAAAAADASPPRRGQRHDSPPDASPPRRRTAAAAADASPSRRGQRHDSPPDASPPRRRPAAAVPDASPPRRGQRHDSPPDASPPRRRPATAVPDASPPRRRAAAPLPDASPPRRGKRHDSPPDASPPRRRQRHDSPPDASPPRRRPGAGPGPAADASPPRRRTRHDSPDASPPRRGRSPPGRGAAGAGAGPSSAAAAAAGGGGRGSMPPPPDRMGPPPPPDRMGDGTAAGLVSAEQLARDLAVQKAAAEERRRNAVGRGASTVYRDKVTGKVMSAEEAAQAKEDERAARRKPSIYDEDQTLEWRSGLAQKREAEERRRAMEEEAAKPFARAQVDDAHDAALRTAVRFGDPFAHLARKKAGEAGAAATAALTERYDSERLGKSGFKVPQEVPPHSWLKRGVAAPANRYNMRPGRHWDGVNRSNGFEAQLFKTQNTRAHQELEARLWSMGDM